ncbi:MAG: TIGR04282 family arsenosugar biosynthesis glycosyltransferase [Dissulfuribacterales bacterium]
MSFNAVAIFTKYPYQGQVKTRLAATIGAEKACQLHTKMTYHALNMVMQLQREGVAECIVFFHGADRELAHIWIKSGLDRRFFYDPLMLLKQYGEELGARMHHAFQQMSDMGYEKMLLMGTDCPELTKEILQDALSALSDRDVVFGPALDGGYYLIGMKAPNPILFQDIPWSREDTLEQTLRRCRYHNISYAMLPTLRDIDTGEDLAIFTRSYHEFECHHPCL